MKLNGNTSKRSAAAKREAADFAAQERSAHRSASARSAQSEAAARRAAAPKQAAQRPPVSRQADPAQGTPQPKARKPRGRGGKIADGVQQRAVKIEYHSSVQKNQLLSRMRIKRGAVPAQRRKSTVTPLTA